MKIFFNRNLAYELLLLLGSVLSWCRIWRELFGARLAGNYFWVRLYGNYFFPATISNFSSLSFREEWFLVFLERIVEEEKVTSKFLKA